MNGDSVIVPAMSPRPRLKPNSDVVLAAIRVIERLGPSRLTLADVAKEAGLAPATLMQRFGSKRGLLLEVARLGASGVREEFARIRAQHRSPLAALGGVAECMAQMARTPEVLANSLAFLEMDLADPEFHRLALTHARRFRAELRALIVEAVSAGELCKCPAAALANAVQAMIGGSMLNWAIHREGKAKAFIMKDVEMLLRPYRTPGAKSRKRAP
jgi:AcrR family transcriptional regulator